MSAAAPRTSAAIAAAANINAAEQAAAEQPAASTLPPLTEDEAAALGLDSDTINAIRLDGLALTKIVKHSRDAHPNVAPGVLLGLEIDSALEVSNVFALPKGSLGGGGSGGNDDDDENDKGAKAGESSAHRSFTSQRRLGS